MNFDNDIKQSIEVLNAGGLILYPTDTIWGIGCDATNKNAIEKIYTLKNRQDKKTMIILVADEKNILTYIETPDKKIFDYLRTTEKPTTVIYEGGKNVSQNLKSDGTIAIRIVRDIFCKELITEFKKPIVSTSANISGEPFPKNFTEIHSKIKKGVDYIVQHRQNDLASFQPSAIIKLNMDGKIEILRS
jgi:L-threonylcarbamoyladenylate synthase